jgi:hypothetical protein
MVTSLAKPRGQDGRAAGATIRKGKAKIKDW